MQNMEIILYPKQIYITTHPLITIRLIYKKMSITTNHQLQKYQNRESYQIKNSVATINDQIKFKLSKQFEFTNTKIVIIVIGIKGRQVLCLGDVSLDLASLKEKKNKQKQLLKMKLQKCKDPKAFLTFDIKFIQKPIDLNQIKKNKKQKIPQLGILKTQCYYKQQLYISRRQNQDKPTAYQISRKNYKNNQILRNQIKTLSKDNQEKRYSKDSSKQNSNNGSYKKRFLYDVKRNDKSQQKSATKSISSNYLKVYQKDKSPSPRIKTPQPITLQTLKTRQTHNRTQSKVSPLNLSGFQSKRTHQIDDTNQLIDPDTFRAQGETDSNRKEQRRQTFPQNIHQKDLAISNISSNSISSITNEKDNKYKMITQKLQLIERKIRKSKEKYDEDSKSRDADSRISKNQIDQLQSYQIGGPSRRTQIMPSKISKNPLSPQQSTCPRNQKAPSPIGYVETPSVNKQQKDEIKMSQFTINSRKNQINELEQQKTPQSSSPIQQSQTSNKYTNKTSFNQISEPLINSQQMQRRTINKNQKGGSQSPQNKSKQKRQISPPTLSFQRRQSQLKMQRKSSIGRNYLQTQVKMLQLQIQDKDMKYERLEKKYNKKEQQCMKLIKENEQYEKKITTISNQIIEIKTKNIQLQKSIQEQENIKSELINKNKQLQSKQKKIKQKQTEINKLNLQINKLNLQIEQLKLNLSNLSNQKTIQTDHQPTQQKQNNNTYKQIQQKYQSLLKTNNLNIQTLNQQIEIYNNQIINLRQRNQQLSTFKTKYQQLNKANSINIQKIINLQHKIKQLQIINQNQKSVSNFSSSSDSPKNQTKKELPYQSKSTQQILQQTIQKQTILQQSLKSIQSKNKSLSQKLNSSQTQKISLVNKLNAIQKNKNQLQTQISRLKGQIQQLEIKNKQLQNSKKLNQQKLQKKQITIQKLSSINQSLNSKIFQLQQKQKTNNHQQINQQTQTLIMKNAQLQQQIHEITQKLSSKQKQIKILKQLLRDKQQEENKTSKHKSQMKRQLERESSNSMQNLSQPAYNTNNKEQTNNKSQIFNIKVTQQGKQNYYQNYLNQKAKCTNLQAQLRFAQNQIRNQKMRIQLLTQQKKNLQQQIDMIAYNNQKDLAKKGLQHKVSLQSQSIADNVKIQNKILKQQIKLLQSQVRDLNNLLDAAIQKTTNLQSSQISSIGIHTPAQKSIMGEKYLVLLKRLQAYQNQLRSKKNKMAQMVNAIWRGGNANLIDQIDRIMGVQE